MANLVLETLQLLATLFLHYVIAFARLFVPVPRKSIQDEIVLITGAGSGIGKGMAIEFAKIGAKIVCVDINKQANDQTVEVIKSLNQKAFGYKCDCSSREDIYRVADIVKREVGEVTILVNNAGIVSGKKFLDTEDWMIQKTMEVNTMAHFWTVKSFLPSMLAKNHGHVVNIASSAGFFGVPGMCDYCSSKFGAVGFDESLRMELSSLGKTGVKTTVVCPYYINTGMFDGVKTRFPLLLPILDPDWVVKEIVDAVLRNKEVLILPKILSFFLVIKWIIPSSSYVLLANYFGISNSMESFRGRAKKD
ncbi:epidermal retinol dehydrogenase 2 [Nematostella vectensis]|uniref:epidermal retinol dehydrogenase 2 n=1 Tax=Nematostella vectensis TaxID=45351 RepID=UPI0020777CCD|nr:epidermal retinol dehydrogenase 2 [Nematostella vectensis]